MQKAENPPLTRAITDLVPNALVAGEEVEQVEFLWWFYIKFNFVGEKHQAAGYRTEVHRTCYSNFGSASVAFDGYPENLTTTDNAHK